MDRIISLFSDLPSLLINLVVVLLSLSVHEVAHGYAAYKLGDPTAKSFGRLSLNPLKHIDPIGFVCMFLFRFGWAKPVPINTRYFKKPRRDMALTALAGPLSNIILSFIGLFLYKCVYAAAMSNPALLDTGFKYNLVMLILEFFNLFCILNLYLGVFNLIPVPPLDGSRILFVVLPDNIYFGVMQYERYIQIALFALLYLGVLSQPLSAACTYILNGMDALLSLLPIF